MRRHLIGAGGGSTSEGGGGGPLPPDPTLTETRSVTRPYAMHVNAHNVTTTGGQSFQYVDPIVLMEDASAIRFVCTGRTAATSYKLAWRKGTSGPWAAVLFAGVDGVSFTDDSTAKSSDWITGTFAEGESVYLRSWAPAGAFVPEGGSTASGTVIAGSDQRLASSWTATEPFPIKGPFPVVIEGKARSSVISPALWGDSIGYDSNWWRDACAANGRPGSNLGVPVYRFTSRNIVGLLAGATHLLVQFGVNDLADGLTLAQLWTRAVDAYAYADAQKPGIPKWQTTPTPVVSTTDAGATLANQTPDEPRSTLRAEWNLFLRDGAPCNPTTKAALAVGTSGGTGTVIRMGQTGHPLQGLVDIAAAVEQGGSSSPTKKWRVDLGPLAGDGTHPSTLGQTAMTPPVTAWVASLT